VAEHKTPALDWRWCVALLLLALVAHAGSLGAGLVYDDGQLLAENPFLRDPGNLSELFTPHQDRLHRGYFESEELSWRPVATAVHLVEFALLGIDGGAPPAAAYDASGMLHAVSWLLHAVVALCCFGLLTALRLPRHAAFAGAALFAVHPVLVEPVMMVSFREDLLATGFVVGAAWLVARGPGGWGQAAVLGLMVLLACGSKESALVAPGLLALVAWYRAQVATPVPSAQALEGNEPGPAVWWRVWLPAAVCIAAATGVYALFRFALITHPGEQQLAPLPGGIPGLLAADLWILGQYLWSLVWPWTLLIDRTVTQPLPWLGALAGGLAAFCVAAVAWGERFARPGVTAPLAWSALALLPVMNLVPTSIPLADRFLYLPFIGVAWAAAVLTARAVPSLDAPTGRRAVALAAVVAIACIARNHRRAADFADDPTLWAATYRSNPGSARACANHGLLERNRAGVLLQQQRLDEAAPLVEEVVRLHRRAVELDPGERANRTKLAASLAMRAELHKVLGRAEASAADLEAALEQMHIVLDEEPTRSPAWVRLGDLLQQRGGPGDRDRALEHYRRAMELEPLRFEPLRLYSSQLALAGKHRQGLAVLDDAPPEQRNRPEWFRARAWIQQESGDRNAARRTLEAGMAAFPFHPGLRQDHLHLSQPGPGPR
jgi:tetratricopeptide (TPR) repeat protein